MPPKIKTDEELSNLWDTKMYKFLGVTTSLILGASIGFLVYFSQMDARVKILEDRQSVVLEIKQDVKDIKNDINTIKIGLATDGRIGWMEQDKMLLGIK